MRRGLMNSRSVAVALVLLLMSPLAGSIAATSAEESLEPLDAKGLQMIEVGQTIEVPNQAPIWWDTSLEWWELSLIHI